MSKDTSRIVPDVEMDFSTTELSIDDILKQHSTEEDNFEGNDGDNFSVDDIEEIVNPGQEYTANLEKETDILDTVKSQMSEFDDPEAVTGEENKEGTENKQEEGRALSDDVYSAAFDFIREQGILNIPDDIEELNEETTRELIQRDQEARNQRAFDYVKDQAGDERIQELFDHVYKGGTWDDFEPMKETIQAEIDFQNLDPTKEEDSRFLIQQYLMEGLNPENPAHALRLEKVPEDTQNYFDRLESEDIAAKAKDYFLGEIAKDKQSLAVQQQERLKQEEMLKQQAVQDEKQWINDFTSTLKTRDWSKDKKDNVIQQFGIVELNDGTETELWRYKWNNMWKKPKLVHVFMDFLSELDPNTMEFGNRALSSSKKVSNKIFEMAKRKAAGNKKSGKAVSPKRQASDSNNNNKINPFDLI